MKKRKGEDTHFAIIEVYSSPFGCVGIEEGGGGANS